jgi:CIC family chloride channel protein
LPIHVRLMFGGLVVGGIAIGWPEVWGNGYAGANRLLTEPMVLHVVLGLLLAKVVATVAAVGAGTVGGVFTPTLFVGAGVGTAFGMMLHAGGHALQLPTHIFALVGMGSVLAATVHSPLLAMIMIFEISLNYSMMPPLMLSCVLATLVARRLHPDSVYTSSLRDHDIDPLAENTTLGASQMQRIGDIMRAPVPPVRDDTLLPDLAAQFLKHAYNYLPVINDKEHLIGLVALHDIKPHLHAADELKCVIASDIMIPVGQVLTPSDLVLDALPKLLKSDQRNIPVVNDLRSRQLVGSVSKSEALALLSEAIAAHTRLRTR